MAEKKFGGPFSVLATHIEMMRPRHRIDLSVVVDDACDLPAAGCHLSVFRTRRMRSWRYAGGLVSHLQREAAGDVLHAHMLWDYPTLAALIAGNRKSRPVVITPHGAIIYHDDRWRSLKKQVYFNLLRGRPKFFHALNAYEADCLRRFGVSDEIFVVPNTVLPEGSPSARESPGTATAGDYFLYLGRIWREKGIPELVQAWSRSGRARSGDRLLICGPDYRGYARDLAREIEADERLRGSIVLREAVAGADKWALIRQCKMLVLPSRGEAFSMAMLEALSQGKAVLFTKQCNMDHVASAGGGLMIDDLGDSFSRALMDPIMDDERAIGQMGTNAKGVFDRQYSPGIVSGLLDQMYAEVAERA